MLQNRNGVRRTQVVTRTASALFVLLVLGSAGPAVAAEAVKHSDFDKLVAEAQCLSCHAPKNHMGAPTWKQVAKKYQKDRSEALEAQLVYKVAHGGSGSWGKMSMPPYPELKTAEVRILVQGILATGTAKTETKKTKTKKAARTAQKK